MDPDYLVALKAICDVTRLRILGLLADGRQRSPSVVAEALGSSVAPVDRQLRRLLKAGLVTAMGDAPGARGHRLRVDRLAQLGAALDREERATTEVEPRASDVGAGGSAADRKVLRSFLEGGRLTTIPAQDRKRQVVLRFLAETDFEPGREYPEKEVNQVLALRHPDVASLRRYLVDSGYLTRTSGRYRLRDASTWPGADTPAAP